MTGDLEARLASWMQSVEVAPETVAGLRVMELPPRTRRGWLGRLLPALLTGGVVVALAAVVLSTTPSHRPPIGVASPSVSPASDSTPGSSSLPTPSLTASQPCQANNLSATERDRGSSLGNGGAIVRVTNIGPMPCLLTGYPDVALLGSAGQRLPTHVTQATEGDYLFPPIPVTDVVLDTSGVASFQIGYPALSNEPLDVACPTAAQLEVTLPEITEPIMIDADLAPCDGQLNVSAIHAGADWIGFSGPEPDAGQVNLGSMAWFDPQHGLLVGGSGPDGSVGTIWRTADGGRTWQSVTVAGGGLGVVTISGSSAWAGSACSLPAPCRNPLLRSDDGGATWARVAYQPVAAIAFADARRGWAIAFSQADVSDPSILVSSDGGATWIPKPSPCPPGTGVPAAISFPAPDRGWLACNGTLGAGSATKAILQTTDGERWDVLAASVWPHEGDPAGKIESSGYLAGLSMVASGTGMYWADRGISERTSDGGTIWTGMTATSFDVVIPAFGWAIDDQNWLLYVWNGDLGRFVLEESTDGGASWGESPVFVAPS